MVSTRLLGVISTSMLVVGALSIGQVFHLTIVTGEVSFTATPVVVYGVAGVIAIAIGYRARRPVAEEYALTSDARERGEHERERGRSPSSPSDSSTPSGEETDDGSDTDGTDDAFDPAMSPLGDAEPGDAERERREGDADR
ncbi:hypothetical protein Hbl1158_07760 [Halobaculum sp. CBA1158]|uniref:hypothetical protein n=1 Tax=Halobaculum sp. CBA1158 TaxID=2904243 RepID=UPI001F3C2B43|nr:hypothetical protein [Halobaculum sp. CBA1158]UIO98461.1 hypothetical protein Hbl1158_07760 [Halobaculum sp. CBA1158]